MGENEIDNNALDEENLIGNLGNFDESDMKKRKLIRIIIIISIILALVIIGLVLFLCLRPKNEDTDDKNESFRDLQNIFDNLIESKLNLNKNYIFNIKEEQNVGIIIKNKSIIINGNNRVINGITQSKIFDIYNSKIIFNNINFVNGYSKEYGSAINLINSSLEIINCSFSYNEVNIRGGAINLNNSNMNISNCIFNSNYAKGIYTHGGAIASNNSIIILNNTKFENNSADEGGAIYSINSFLNIYNNNLYNNNANYYGGAILSDSSITIDNSKLYNNKAGYKGGSIHTTNVYSTIDDLLNINNSFIFNNSAEYGGAISSSNRHYINIYNTEIYENYASFGSVISRMSRNYIEIFNSKLYNNFALNGSILYSVAGGNNIFINDTFKNNTAYIGALIYTISGRYMNQINNFSSQFINCNLIDNYGEKGLIYSFFDELIINYSSITYLNKSYNIPIIYKIVNGIVKENYNWWGEEIPNLKNLIIYIFDNNLTNYKLNKINNLTDGCSSTIIQIDDDNSAFTFRRDSSKSVYVNIVYQKDGILQYKTDETFFWHAIINKNGWIFGNGGVDSPYSCEQYEAFAKIMIKNNNIMNGLIEEVLKLKSLQTLGHYFIKSPNGTYSIVIHDKSKQNIILEQGHLKPGEYIISPNNYQFYKKGNISEFNIDKNYTLISRYIAAIDQYSSLRTNLFTYNYVTNIINEYKIKYIDIFISNDDGSLSNKSNTSKYFNDIFINDEYILGEKIPIIMNGMYLDRYIISNDL